MPRRGIELEYRDPGATAPAAIHPPPAMPRRRGRCPPRVRPPESMHAAGAQDGLHLLDGPRQCDEVGNAAMRGQRVALERDARVGGDARSPGPRISSSSRTQSWVSRLTRQTSRRQPPSPTSSTSAGRSANSPTVTTPGELVDARLRARPGRGCRGRETSRMWLPLSVTTPSRQAGAPPKRASLPGHQCPRHRDHFDRQRETGRAGRPASGRRRCRRSGARRRRRSSRGSARRRRP